MRDRRDNDLCEDPCCSCCLRFREAWTTGSIYRPGDAVPLNGSSYAAINWNQNDPPPSANWALIASKGDTGPAGPQGSAGAQGPVGAQGPAGPSSLSSAFTGFGRGEVQFGTDGSDFARITLPAGAYAIWATVPITNTDTDPQSWSVQLSASNGASIQGGASGRIAPLEESSTEVVPILATCVSPVETTITFRGFGFNIGVFPDSEGRNCTIMAITTQFV
jgi:hypothetical protein